MGWIFRRPVINLGRLRQNKRAAGRAKNLADLENLPEANSSHLVGSGAGDDHVLHDERGDVGTGSLSSSRRLRCPTRHAPCGYRWRRGGNRQRWPGRVCRRRWGVGLVARTGELPVLANGDGVKRDDFGHGACVHDSVNDEGSVLHLGVGGVVDPFQLRLFDVGAVDLVARAVALSGVTPE